MNAHPPAALLRYAELLEPVSVDAPCGPDLEYDPDFVMLLAAAAPRVEAQYGDFVDVPPAANWAEIERECRALLLRTKDIRLAVILLRCRARLDGATGLRDGLAFLNAMFECYSEALHPLPMLDGERDPVMYANAIAALVDPDGALGDARDIAMPKAAGLQLHLRDIEKSFAMPRQKDALAPESVTLLLKELWGRRDAAVAAFVDAQRFTASIAAWCDTTLGADAPDLSTLSRLLRPFAQPQLDGGSSSVPAGARPAAQTPVDTAPAAMPAPGSAVPSPPSGTPFNPLLNPIPNASAPPTSTALPAALPTDRWSALTAIQETRRWFEQNEPSSPVIILLRQSERMVGKRFSELAHVIPADLLVKWDEVDN
ncbi:type VI secretion system protein TssA [Paraburkholderia susongensis]|uniref:Type VI secretion system protein ImpA n=1 Tax=Paraburkholderia susongensis TaxID=1515439 RepID=A0A1X7LKP2_9BURK|nr:type VI secretion system ImpA family N-terminal domain-containing protein [Paraburkholderia susongensis]SMG54230.1 type VI secretion system protein ImpA [Paraburkholderia susongensis]